jgi:hypothetical protein
MRPWIQSPTPGKKQKAKGWGGGKEYDWKRNKIVFIL